MPDMFVCFFVFKSKSLFCVCFWVDTWWRRAKYGDDITRKIPKNYTTTTTKHLSLLIDLNRNTWFSLFLSHIKIFKLQKNFFPKIVVFPIFWIECRIEDHVSFASTRLVAKFAAEVVPVDERDDGFVWRTKTDTRTGSWLYVDHWLLTD